MKKALLTFATTTNHYAYYQKKNTEIFLRYNNFDQIYALDENSIPKDYYNKHEKILSQKRGAGYWLWKPYFINKILSKLDDGDILMYTDAAVQQIKDLSPIFNLLEKQSVLPHKLDSGIGDERRGCKRDVYLLLNCDNEKYWTGDISGQFGAAYIFIKKNQESVRFVSEWLSYCEDERVLTDIPNTLGESNVPDFVDHRHDQAVYSVLCKKYGFKPIYDITQYGNSFRPREESWGQLLYHER